MKRLVTLLHAAVRSPPSTCAAAPPASPLGIELRDVSEAAETPGTFTFGDVYDEHFDFVWRTTSRLGVPESAVADVCQEVFIVVHRRLPEFEPRGASLKTWLYEIVRRIVRDYRRTRQRKPLDRHEAETDPDVLPARAGRPDESADTAQRLRLLHDALDAMDDDKRELFVLAELEQWTVPEIAQAYSLNVNTMYTRLRAARAQFMSAVRAVRAHSEQGPHRNRAPGAKSTP